MRRTTQDVADERNGGRPMEILANINTFNNLQENANRAMGMQSEVSVFNEVGDHVDAGGSGLPEGNGATVVWEGKKMEDGRGREGRWQVAQGITCGLFYTVAPDGFMDGVGRLTEKEAKEAVPKEFR